MPILTDLSNNRFRILQALNKQENTNITNQQFNDNFTFSEPERAGGILPRKNTKLKLLSKFDSGYYGNKTIFYNRIHTSKIGTITVTRTTEVTLLDLLPQINSNYHLELNQYDVINYTLSNSQVGTFELTLPINPSSLMFYDGQYIVTRDEVVMPPVNPPAGTLISTFCQDFDKFGNFADGNGGIYVQLLERDSLDCGYEPDSYIYITIDGGDSSSTYPEPWQTAGGGGANLP